MIPALAATGTLALVLFLLFGRPNGERQRPAASHQGLAAEAAQVPRAARADDVVQDRCCWDLDGGGPPDDGVFTVSRSGEVVRRVVLYDDRDGSRSFSPGDIIRWSGGST